MYIILKNKKVEIKTKKSLFSRLLSLTFKMEPIKYGLCFPKCNYAHSFFMYQPIDIAMTDDKNKILYLYQGFKPWKFIIQKEDVTTTYVFGNNMLNEYSINDTLKIKTTDK